MSDPQKAKPKLSVFAAAEKPGLITAEIGIREVMALSPGWTEEQARTFLANYGSMIGEVMLVSALQIVDQLIKKKSQIS